MKIAGLSNMKSEFNKRSWNKRYPNITVGIARQEFGNLGRETSILRPPCFLQFGTLVGNNGDHEIVLMLVDIGRFLIPHVDFDIVHRKSEFWILA